MQPRNYHDFEHYTGSGNIFADLDFNGADDILAKTDMGIILFKLIRDSKLKPRQVAAKLQITRKDVLNILKGHWHKYTLEQLIHWKEIMENKND